VLSATHQPDAATRHGGGDRYDDQSRNHLAP
jgi:hypothetical protein